MISRTPDGVPTFVRGRLAQLGQQLSLDPSEAVDQLRGALPLVVAPFRLTPDDLVVRRIVPDPMGGRHVRYDQRSRGRDVVGGDLVVHVAADGGVVAVNGSARGDVPPDLDDGVLAPDQAIGRVAGDPRFAGLTASARRDVYLLTPDGRFHRASEVLVEGERDDLPLRDHVYVDRADGSIVAVHPQVHTSIHRTIYEHDFTFPGKMVRKEGQAPIGDPDVDDLYTFQGITDTAYHAYFGHAGYSSLASTVKVVRLCNAYWDGNVKRFVFGWGTLTNPVCQSLSRSLDVVAHEFQHSVTDLYSNLVYEGESGGINEAMSDVFGGFVQAWNAGLGGELLVTDETFVPGFHTIAGGFRRMCDPAELDAADLWTPDVGTLNPHDSSGVVNLAFCLLAKGGSHPRGKTDIVVPGIGLEKAIGIIDFAQTSILSSTSTMSGLWAAMWYAADVLYAGDRETLDAVTCAFAAVGVPLAGPYTCNRSDLVWRDATGAVEIWGNLDGDTVAWRTQPGNPGPDWRLAGVGDFNADGQDDLVWTQVDRGLDIWLMRDGEVIGNFHPFPPYDNPVLAAVGDFDGGGAADLLWRSPDGSLVTWLMHDGVPRDAIDVGVRTDNWEIAGVGDFNRDGMTDIFWRDAITGIASVWLMKDGKLASSTDFPLPLESRAVVQGIGDFDHDGIDDVLARDPVAGDLAIWFMEGAGIRGVTAVDKLAPEYTVDGVDDLDGDAKADIVMRHQDGTVVIWFMNGATIVAHGYPGTLGADWSLNATGQLD